MLIHEHETPKRRLQTSAKSSLTFFHAGVVDGERPCLPGQHRSMGRAGQLIGANLPRGMSGRCVTHSSAVSIGMFRATAPSGRLTPDRITGPRTAVTTPRVAANRRLASACHRSQRARNRYNRQGLSGRLTKPASVLATCREGCTGLRLSGCEEACSTGDWTAASRPLGGVRSVNRGAAAMPRPFEGVLFNQ